MMIRFGSSQSPNRLPGTDGNPSPLSKKLRGQAATTMAQLQMTAPDSEQAQELREIADRFERNTPANGRGGDHTYHVIEQVPDSHPLMRAALLRQRLGQRLAQKQAEQQKQEAFRKAEELAAKNLSAEELTKEMEKLGFTLLSDSGNPFALSGPAQADSPAEDKADQKESAEPSGAPQQKTPAQIEAAKRRKKAQAARRKEKAAAAKATENSQTAPSPQES